MVWAHLRVVRNVCGVKPTVPCKVDDLDTYDTNTGRYAVLPGVYTLIAAQHSGELPQGSTAEIVVVD